MAVPLRQMASAGFAPNERMPSVFTARAPAPATEIRRPGTALGGGRATDHARVARDVARSASRPTASAVWQERIRAAPDFPDDESANHFPDSSGFSAAVASPGFAYWNRCGITTPNWCWRAVENRADLPRPHRAAARHCGHCQFFIDTSRRAGVIRQRSFARHPHFAPDDAGSAGFCAPRAPRRFRLRLADRPNCASCVTASGKTENSTSELSGLSADIP